MPGPARKTVKHGRTPNVGPDWTEVDDVPFEGAGPLPPVGGRKKWHDWTVEWYAEVSTMPHCALWGRSTWRLLFDLARMKDAWYKDGDDAKASASAQIRLRERDLGIGPGALAALKIRYVPVLEAADGADEPRGGSDDQFAVDQDDTGADPDSPPAKPISLADRRRAITKSA